MAQDKKYTVYTHKVVTDDKGPMWYVGVTSTRTYKRWTQTSYKSSSLWPYIEQYGWYNIEHCVIADGLDKETAYKLEDCLILMYNRAKCCINARRSGLLTKDRKAYSKQYYVENIEKYQQYDYKHREEKKAYHKKWYEEHLEEQRAKNNRYREEHRDEKIVYLRKRRSTPEGKIYMRVTNFNRTHKDRVIETPKEALDKYLATGYIPDYIKNDDIQ